MHNSRPWVPALAIALAASVVVALPAGAQQSLTVSTTVVDWVNPGSFPFTGSFNDVCNLYDHTLTDEQCLRALSQYEADITDDSIPDVGTEIYLQDGDILQVSFTVNGVHKQKTLRVAFGANILVDDPMRRAMVYDTGRPDGVKLVRPDICGNWSIMTISNASLPPPEPVIVTRVVYGPRTVCEVPEAFTLVTPSQYVPGLSDACNCGEPLPGVFIGGETVVTYGSPVCNTIFESTEEEGD